jgi:hypothetical protein
MRVKDVLERVKELSALRTLPNADCSRFALRTRRCVWNDYNIAVNPREICVAAYAFEVTSA